MTGAILSFEDVSPAEYLYRSRGRCMTDEKGSTLEMNRG
jgi:hypothetical protein